VTFLSPLAFLLLTLSVPLLLLYFLKVRRQQRRVSSVLLWAPALRDQQASALFQRLQLDPLLLLQILALVLLALALARPTITLQGKGTDRLVLVMDVSASMKATDVVPSRFAEARRAALQLAHPLDEHVGRGRGRVVGRQGRLSLLEQGLAHIRFGHRSARTGSHSSGISMASMMS